MPRTLPWLIEKTSAQASGRRNQTPAAKRSKPPNVVMSDDESPAATAQFAKPTSTTPRKRRASRTPSTSPPPAPPKEEFMRPGPTQDDGWMMVEDEFYAVAQAFTLPLHRQEYDRLKLKARSTNLNLRDIARPTTTQALRKELHHQKDAEALRKKHRKVLGDMTAGLERDSESDESGSGGGQAGEAISDREDDPWFGTTLHGLMMTSPEKTARREGPKALVGLEKVKSTTRAARGFGQRQPGLLSSPSRARSDGGVGGGEEDTNEDDSDLDLDLPSRVGVSEKVRPQQQQQQKGGKPAPQLSKPSFGSSSHVSRVEKSPDIPLSKGRGKGKGKAVLRNQFNDDFDDLASSSSDHTYTKKKLSPEIKPMTPKKETGKMKKKYNDVPTFLV